MKYRIMEHANRFYPQFTYSWYTPWFHYKETFGGYYTRSFDLSFDSRKEADEFILRAKEWSNV